MTRAFTHSNADLNNYVLLLLGIESGDRVLEIGFGPGALINNIALNSDTGLVEGIDFSPTMLAQATRTNQSLIATGRVRLQLGDSRQLPYDDDAFDKICTVNTIYFWEDPDTYLKEIFRVIKRGGKLVVGFRDKQQLDSLPLSDDVFNKYTSDQVTAFLSGAGFEDISIEEKDGSPFASHCAVAIRRA